MKKISVLFLILLVGCSTVKNTAVDVSAKIISEASYELETESNWDNFKQAVIPNLKMIEGVLYVRKDNTNLLATLTKGYSAYAYVVNETQYLPDLLNGEFESKHLDQAQSNYKKSIKYGIEYLEEFGVSYKDLLVGLSNTEKMELILDSKLDATKRAYETIFFFAQASMNMANLNKRNMSLVGQLPLFKKMIDWACSNDNTIAGGSCSIVEALYLASRPRMMGGDPKKAREILESFVKKNPNHYFGRLALIQYILIPAIDEDAYKEHKNFFETVIANKKNDRNWSPLEKEKDENKNLRIYQALALKRFEIIKGLEKDIF